MIISPISLTTSLGGLFIPFFFAILDIAGMQYVDVVLYGMYYAVMKKYGQPDANGRIYITVKNSTVAERLRTSTTTIKRAKKRLKDARLIDVVRVGYGRTSRIYLFDYRDVIAANTPENPAASTANEQSSLPTTGAAVSPPDGAEVVPAVGSPKDPDNNIISTNDIIYLSLTVIPDNVKLTPEQYAHLGKAMREHRDAYIRHYSKRKAERGYTFPCDYDALINWWASDRERWIAGDRRKEKNRRSPKPGEAGNSFDEDDFFAAALERSFGGELPPQIMR